MAAPPPPTGAGHRAATTSGHLTLPSEKKRNSMRENREIERRGSKEREWICKNEEKWVLHPFYTNPCPTGSTQLPPKPARSCRPIQQGPFCFSPFIFFCLLFDIPCLLPAPPFAAFFISFARFLCFASLVPHCFIILMHCHPFKFIILLSSLIVYLFLSHLESVFRS